MPIHTCTTALGTLTAETKAALAGEVTRIHAADNHVPPEYVNVVFQELPTDAVFVGGQPGAPMLISGWARRGHPQEGTTRLALQLSAVAARIAQVDESRVLVVMTDSPAHSAVERGPCPTRTGRRGQVAGRKHDMRSTSRREQRNGPRAP